MIPRYLTDSTLWLTLLPIPAAAGLFCASVYAYLRLSRDQKEMVVVLLNFTPLPRYDYRVGVPKAGFYTEIMNTDAAHYGGGNIGNAGGVYSEPTPSHGHPQSLSLTIPPLGMLVLKAVTVGAPAAKPAGK